MLKFTPNPSLPHDHSQRVQCPKCAEWIRFEAKVCPHCKSEGMDWKRGMIQAIAKKEAGLVKAKRLFYIVLILAFIIGTGLLVGLMLNLIP